MIPPVPTYRGTNGRVAGAGRGPRSRSRSTAEAGAADLTARFAETLRHTGLILPGQSVLIALSGGLDSMVLLDLLGAIASEWELTLCSAHFDHRMRPESGADADWVREECGARGVALVTGAADVSPRGEAAARRQRYRFLRRVARSVEADRVATAHHADDQIETVLFRLARGTSTRGIAGIPLRRGILVRPLLGFRRSELEAHAAAARIAHREDPTNRDVAFRRNLIRHEVLPLLRRVAPGADDAILRLAGHARADEGAWDTVLDEIESRLIERVDGGTFELARPAFLSYHPQVQARLLRRVFRAFGAAPDAAGTRAALAFISSGASGRRVRVRGVEIERAFDRIVVRVNVEQTPDRAADTPVVMVTPGANAGIARIGGRAFDVRWWVDATGESAKVHGDVAFDVASLSFPLTLRGWQPGDRIAREYGSKKLKKVFAERRVSIGRRRSTPVLVDADGRVLWAVGIASAAGKEPVRGRPALLLAVTEC